LQLLDLFPELLLQCFDHDVPDFETTKKGDARPEAGRRMNSFYRAWSGGAIPVPTR
jgi:hypothetical protein